jgi:hypothetical protein
MLQDERNIIVVRYQPKRPRGAWSIVDVNLICHGVGRPTITITIMLITVSEWPTPTMAMGMHE